RELRPATQPSRETREPGSHPEPGSDPEPGSRLKKRSRAALSESDSAEPNQIRAVRTSLTARTPPIWFAFANQIGLPLTGSVVLRPLPGSRVSRERQAGRTRDPGSNGEPGSDSKS